METPNATRPGHGEPSHEDGCDRVWLEFQASLQALPILPRLAFLLTDVLGKPVSEVAALLGRDPATCRQLIDDARTRLRAMHASAHGDEP
jgi:RNA polymerase sigma-70 factor, ECF subfamily